MTFPLPTGRRPILRAGSLCALAAIELIGFQLRFDQRAILDSPQWWAQLLWYYPALFNIALLCGGGVAMLSWRSLVQAAGAWRRDEAPWGGGRFFGAHVVFIVLFYGLSVAGLQNGAAAGPAGTLWFSAWFTCGLLATAAWCCALVRPSSWKDLVNDGGRRIAWGLALGSSLWLGAQFLTRELFASYRTPTLMAVASVLRATGHDASFTAVPARIGIDGFRVRMSPACFGYEGMALVMAFSIAYLVAMRRSLAFPRSLLLVILAASVSWGMNVLRLSALVLIGAYQGRYAIEGFHSVAGWLYFAAIAAGIVALSQRRWFARDREDEPPTQPAANPAAPYLVPLLVLLATSMITRIFTVDFDIIYPVRAVVVGVVLVWYRNRIVELGWRGSAWAALPGVLIFVGWIALEPAPAQSAIASGLAQLPGWAATGWLAFRVIGSSVTVPLAEELAFRGYVIRKLTSADFERVPDGGASLLALIVSSLLFGMMHGRFLAGTLAGVALALTLVRRGRLADAVVAHGTANVLIAIYALSTQQWSVWE